MPADDKSATDATPDEAPPANPLEAIQQARAKRTPPPGTGGAPVAGKNRGRNPAAPRHYNRHK